MRQPRPVRVEIDCYFCKKIFQVFLDKSHKKAIQ